jgi:hypothetical protein
MQNGECRVALCRFRPSKAVGPLAKCYPSFLPTQEVGWDLAWRCADDPSRCQRAAGASKNCMLIVAIGVRQCKSSRQTAIEDCGLQHPYLDTGEPWISVCSLFPLGTVSTHPSSHARSPPAQRAGIKAAKGAAHVADSRHRSNRDKYLLIGGWRATSALASWSLARRSLAHTHVSVP